MKRVWIKRAFIGFICLLSFLSLVNLGIMQDVTETPEPPLPSPLEAGMAPIDDVQLYYAAYGDPSHEPLLLVHGGLGSADEFSHQIPVFAEKYYVVVFDSRGRGRSTISKKPLSYSLLSADTLALMDYLHMDSTHLVGWSDGGIIGLDIAIHHPDRLKKLVAYGALYNASGNTNQCPTAQCDDYFGILTSTYTRLSPNPGGLDSIFAALSPLDAGPGFTAEQLKSITTPVLIMDGLQEELIRPQHTLELAQMIPTADLRLMNGIGHFAPWYKPEAFNHIVLDYLSQ